MTAGSPPVDLEVSCDSPLWDGMPEAGSVVRGAAAAAFSIAGLSAEPGAELSVLLTDDAHIRTLNAGFRNKDKATNVLTFPAAEPDAIAASPLLGDIVIAFETLAAEAEAEGKALGDHLAHLVVHGILHLYGYDHETSAEAETMEAMERRVLAGLGIADPYAGSSLDAAAQHA